MNKLLTIYPDAYQLAKDIHLHFNENNDYSEEIRDGFKEMAREVVENIDEASKKRGKVKRFFLFKTIDTIHRIMLDIDYCVTVCKMDFVTAMEFYTKYKDLSETLHTKTQKLIK